MGLTSVGLPSRIELCDPALMSENTVAAEPVRAERAKVEKADETHFGGPLGAKLMMVGLPLLTLYLWICIHAHGGALVLPSLTVLREIPLPTARAAGYLVAWLAFQIALQVFLPGRMVKGVPQRDGLTLEYKLNGLLSLAVSLIALVALYATGRVKGAAVLAELGPLLSTSILYSFALGLFLYLYGFSSTRTEWRSGKVLYDYFMGSALNPRIGDFDLKLFFESKIGLTTWIAIDLAMAAAQYEKTGHLSTAMIMVLVFQLFYVVDFYVFEEAMLSTWDINYENYGFMLAFAFVVWMPFNFSLQAQYLVYQAPEIPGWAILGIAALNFAGYYVFRSANLQKHKFRTETDPLIWGEKPTFILTKSGRKLLTSGWWGRARHANYLGDLMMALAWCLPAGFGHVPPYFYFIYFAPLLIDRERRDHRECKKRYGDDWDRYCAKVKYRIVPYLY
jgi:delta14-sterol reductase/lamin-B receptor